MHSPTGYYAHYTTTWKNADGSWGNRWTDTYPVIGYTDTALVLDEEGIVRTVQEMQNILAEGGNVPDEEGSTFRVSLGVNAYPGE